MKAKGNIKVRNKQQLIVYQAKFGINDERINIDLTIDVMQLGNLAVIFLHKLFHYSLDIGYLYLIFVQFSDEIIVNKKGNILQKKEVYVEKEVKMRLVYKARCYEQYLR